MLVTSDIPPPVEQVWPIIDPDEPEFSTMAGPAVQFFGKMWDLPNEKAVRRYLETPVEKMNRSHAWALGHMEDDLTALKVWQKLLKEDPDDLEAAIEVAELTQKLQGSQAAVDAIAATSGKAAVVRDDRADSLSPGHLEGFRCELLLQTHHLEDAQKACDLAIQLDEEYGQRALAKVLLALGKNREALVQARRVTEMPGRMADPGALLTLGLAQQYNGLDSEALATWNVGLARWPGSVYLRKAVDGPKRTVFEWQEDEFAQDTWWQAERLALCGHKLSELGMTDRANECYRQSERLEPGHSLPHQLVFMGMKEPQAALEKALAAVKSAEDAHTQPSLRLLSATGWLYFQLKKFAEAKVWVKRALDWWDWDPKAMSLMWQICGEEKDYLCVIRYRKQLGLPTHFNVEQYRDVKRAWQEQAEKNGVGLAAPEMASTSAQKPPTVRAVEIVPLAARVPPELEGMAEFLRREFPSLKVTIGAREDLPAGAYNIERHQLMWERLAERLRDEPGRIYVVEEDLSSYDDEHGAEGFTFARYGSPRVAASCPSPGCAPWWENPPMHQRPMAPTSSRR